MKYGSLAEEGKFENDLRYLPAVFQSVCGHHHSDLVLVTYLMTNRRKRLLRKKNCEYVPSGITTASSPR